MKKVLSTIWEFLRSPISTIKRLFAKKENIPLFLDLLKEFMEHEANEQELSASTLRKHEGYRNNIELFFKTRQLDRIRVNQLRAKHMEALKLWLHQNLQSCCLTHSARHQELCKRAMRYAVIMEYTLNNPLESVKAKRDKDKDVVHLEPEELKRVVNANYANEIYGIVAELYAFQAYTGLSYMDLYEYEIVQDAKGRFWISAERGKNRQKFDVPLFPEALAIHEKYNGQLPYLTNAAYNRVLKEIAALHGIKKKLTTHTARKTFATLKDNEGWSTPTISQMLGHRSIKTTERHYIKKSRRRIEAELLERSGVEIVLQTA